MIVDLKFVVKCEIFGLDESFEGSCFGHAFPKHVNMLPLWMFLQKSQVCFNQSCKLRFVYMYNLALKNITMSVHILILPQEN
jgi:hypothetical protein